MRYSIKPIGRKCAATGVELAPGTVCRSALVERDGQFQRFDYVASAWEPSPEGTIGHWRTVVPEPTRQAKRQASPDELLQEFERLEESGHEQLNRLRYVLALLLLRKRRLDLEGTRRDGEVEYLILIGSKGEGPFEVVDEHLDPDEIARVETELFASLTAMERDQTPP